MTIRTAGIPHSCALAAVLALAGGCSPVAGELPGDGAAAARADVPAPSKVPIPPDRRQFDLVCHMTRQFDLRETVRDDPRPYRPPIRRDDRLRQHVDLERLEYCWAGACGKRYPVANVTSEGVIFEMQPDLVQFYRWDGFAEGRFTYGGRTSIQQGQCRVEPFSGFGDPGPPPIYLREREGSGPHPLRHEGIHPDDEVVQQP
jgi:hypothetical protein